MPATLYAINQQLDHDFGSESYTAPTNYYMGLSTTSIDNSGSTVTEPADASYERVLIVNDKNYWDSAASGSLTNACAIAFPQSSESWGNIVSAFLSSGSQSGAVDDHVWYYHTLTPAVPVAVNTELTFDVGTITVSRS